jgi:hypothetical protein
MDSEDPARKRINEAVDRLTDEFKDKCSSETIREYVAESFNIYRGSRVLDFVPLLVYRSARDRLGALTIGASLTSADSNT